MAAARRLCRRASLRGRMTVRLKSLTYTSRARLDLTAADIHDIHHTARHFNVLDGITGILAFDGTRFLQVVEGSEDALAHLLERLRRDARHIAIEVRDERFIDARSFPDWAMELVQVSAGYLGAGPDIEAALPPVVSGDMRALLRGMVDDLGRQLRMPD